MPAAVTDTIVVPPPKVGANCPRIVTRVPIWPLCGATWEIRTKEEIVKINLDHDKNSLSRDEQNGDDTDEYDTTNVPEPS